MGGGAGGSQYSALYGSSGCLVLGGNTHGAWERRRVCVPHPPPLPLLKTPAPAPAPARVCSTNAHGRTSAPCKTQREARRGAGFYRVSCMAWSSRRQRTLTHTHAGSVNHGNCLPGRCAQQQPPQPPTSQRANEATTPQALQKATSLPNHRACTLPLPTAANRNRQVWDRNLSSTAVTPYSSCKRCIPQDQQGL